MISVGVLNKLWTKSHISRNSNAHKKSLIYNLFTNNLQIIHKHTKSQTAIWSKEVIKMFSNANGQNYEVSKYSLHH